MFLFIVFFLVTLPVGWFFLVVLYSVFDGVFVLSDYPLMFAKKG